MTLIIDSDTHLMEPGTIYRDYASPAARDLALTVEEDDLGWPWLAHRGRRLHRIDSQVPGDPTAIGAQRLSFEAGRRYAGPAAEIPDLFDPKARIENLNANGVDASFAFPNLGLGWQQELASDLPSLHANMEAYNRWLLELLPDCGDSIHPVAMLSLEDADWFDAELARCARAGIRLAMVAPQPVRGLALAHPELDRVWAAFQHHGVAVCFHVSSIQLPLHPAWYELDPQRGNKLMDTIFLHLAPAVAIANLIVHGKLEQFPGLRIGVVELSAGWVPGFLMHLDGASHFYEQQNGKPLAKMPLRPSEYFRRQVRVNALPLERPADLMKIAGDEIFMWGSDYPHAEGMPRPSFEHFLRVQPRRLEPHERAALGGDNAAFLLGA